MEKDERQQLPIGAHLEECVELSKRLRQQLPPALELLETLAKSFQSLHKTQEVSQKILGPAIMAQEHWRHLVEPIRIPRFDFPDLTRLSAQATEFQNTIQRLGVSAFEQQQRMFRELPPRTQEALLLLAAHGWYLDIEMPLTSLWELKEALAEGKVTEAEDALCDYYESRLAEIEESISKRFPLRAHLIEAAFGAHRRGEYGLSIPVLLAQTDGICKEVMGQYLFMKKDKKPRTAIYVNQITSDSFRAALLSPLARPLEISASEHERSEDSDALNRHAVLHGDSVDYDSKPNSFKAVSLINYVAHVTIEYDQENS